MVKTPEKRGNLNHFVWLALHHVGGWTYAQIASRFQNADGEPNEPAIGRAIQDTANLIRDLAKTGPRTKVESSRTP